MLFTERSNFTSSPFFLVLLIVLTSVFFFHNPVHQERFDLDPEGHLSDWSREGEERAREGADQGGAETENGV